jgi:hypothetical protein
MVTLGIALLILITVSAGALLFGAHRWNARTEALRGSLDAAREAPRPRIVDFRELDGLPPPVQRYFRAVLKEGQAMVASVAIHHAGTFNMGESVDQWKPFTSDQKVVTQRPGFDWDGRIAMMPGVPVRVHDAYVAGEGLLHASLLGLFSLADLRGSGDVAQGELMRFFAEAAWYPTALLPSQGVRWQPAEHRSAYATLTEGAMSTTLLFTFSEQGPIDAVYADARYRMVGGTSVPTPWRGRFWNDAERGGMRVPLDGEVAWVLADGTKPYWRGHILDIEYEFAR